MGIEDVLGAGAVRSVFQPIVELDTGSVVAYEALARGPEGPLERPDVLFAAAREAGRLAELDELCRRTALRGAVAAGVVPPLTLFVNVEPEVLDTAPLDELLAIAADAPHGLQVMLEITERALAARPAELLATVTRLRAAGWRIALDDVGADDLSLAFMPLLRPDVVKLDLRLVQQRPGPAVAEIMNAVNAYAERTGALLLAEGIEDEGHLEMARALGARLGQGWMFGRPAATLATALATAPLDLPATVPAGASQDSPFRCLPEGTALRRSTKPLLIEVSKHLEREALRFGSTCVVVATFQEARHFTAPTAHRYRELAERVGFVAAIGDGLPAEPVAGVRGADLTEGDPVHGEWDIAVLAPHFSAALLARDLGDGGPDMERTFEFALTYDRDVVADAAAALMSRVLPADAVAAVVGAAARQAPAAAAAPRSLAAAPATGTEAERTLRRALAATVNGVTIADVTRPDQPLVYVNTAFERLAGVRAEQVLGLNCRFLQGEDTDPAVVDRLRTAIREGREVRETLLNYRGTERQLWWNEIYLAPVFDDEGRLVQYIGVQNDVTARVEAEAQLRRERERAEAYASEIEHLAFRDPLTGALNRRRLPEVLEATLLQAQMSETGVALLYLDLDEFKGVNDSHGHAVGDALLTGVVSRLQQRLRRGDLVARLGGDEFLLILPGLAQESAAAEGRAVAAELEQLLARPVETPRGLLETAVSIGVAAFPEDGGDFDALLHAADTRMYADKQRRRSSR
ncbi:PAS domain S-box-containing protein/diguanylate cyclase (GGDEF)-like protein [Motilibacter peucedani]|uniref:PAS domain S-box-containing protein/diguanylate cyclase (GGDEF)-like protein n=1 Tax=Motilibacter peucedani TaxID=598650 RepID=A0A420XQB6_9ACTN|nr:EAL domain-containing protein [Motilibacter peucedani]RKS75460.1 PAS domain S-box-containing protein/diguanylate cyclase (GGDEF)-like protein [Motilibacter peucedani]